MTNSRLLTDLGSLTENLVTLAEPLLWSLIEPMVNDTLLVTDRPLVTDREFGHSNGTFAVVTDRTL